MNELCQLESAVSDLEIHSLAGMRQEQKRATLVGIAKSTEINGHPGLLSLAAVNALAKSNWERKSCRFQFLTEAVRAGTRARTMEGIKEGSYSLSLQLTSLYHMPLIVVYKALAHLPASAANQVGQTLPHQSSVEMISQRHRHESI